MRKNWVEANLAVSYKNPWLSLYHVKFEMPFRHPNGDFTWVYKSGTAVNICVKKRDFGVNMYKTGMLIHGKNELSQGKNVE